LNSLNQPSTQTIKIAHVDDELDCLEITKKFIRRYDPYIEIVSYSNPETILKKIDEYDCIVTGYQMHEMNGVQLAKKIREKSDIPIILYTGKGSEEVASAAFEAGFDDYIRKEFYTQHYQVLVMRIRSAVEKYRALKAYSSSARARKPRGDAPCKLTLKAKSVREVRGERMKLKIIEIPCEDYDSEKSVWKGSSYEKLISREKLDLELFVREHFLGLGYKVIRGTDYDPTFKLHGALDFYVEKDGHGFFVEVKSWVDSLKLQQIKWMLEHSDHEFKLAVVPNGFFESPDREISIERENNLGS